ncbi:MAG TPA: carboxyl transferase domain-containing protein [Frankiaceae bacterium]|nr:carboxyl transferase domain-containing protein [Frankiaceae bacterium]
MSQAAQHPAARSEAAHSERPDEPPRPLHRLAIVNRGEPAMRLINAVREWNEQGRPPLRTIAVYTAVDRQSMFVREADEAVLIGPADPDAAGATFGPNPYLDYAELERALRESKADAVWPGWGFVSEKAEFAELCERLGVIFVGPSAEVMRRLGDKIESKRLAERVGVPLTAWSGGPVADVDEARAHARKIGYPLMVKATAGGGGRGIRLVASPEELDEAFERAGAEAAKTAGDATVFLERAVRGGRHVEVQVIADADGTVWPLGVRDCSVQRRNQKVLEESASTALSPEQEEQLRSSAARLVRAAEYVNAGTVEFLFEPEQGLLSFLEVNTRLQVEHPVTEATTGVDIVKLQLHVAAGGKLSEIAAEPPPQTGHAIEARLTAEDPEQGFAPAPGRIEHLVLPSGPGIRVDTGVAPGDVIPPQYDSMIAKVIAWGRDRSEARARLSRAIRQTAAVVEGGSTNKAFLLDLLHRPEFVAGDVGTTWLDTLMADGYTPPRRLDIALLAAAIAAHDAHVLRQQDRLFTSAQRGRPEVGDESWHQVDVRAADESYRLRVSRSRPARYQVELDGQSVEVGVERSGRFERRLAVGDQTFAVLSVAQGPDYLVEVDGAVHRISGGEAGLVRAPSPAMVVTVPVQAGDTVAEGDAVVVLESMKLETTLRAPVAGRVAEVLAEAGTQVESGTKLVQVEPDADRGEASDQPSAARADLSKLTASADVDRTPAWAAADTLAALRSLMLGYDLDETQVRSVLQDLASARAELPNDDAQVLAAETDLLRIFGDLSALSRNRRVMDGSAADPADTESGGEAGADAAARNPREFLHAYLRSRDAGTEGLPESFQAKLRRVLAHYGIADLEPSPDLDPALYRMFLAHRKASAHVPVITQLLQWRLRRPESLADDGREEYREVLDRLVSATQLRHPAVGDLARQVRYRCFDAPLIAGERARVQQEVRTELDRLSDDPAARAAQMDAMVETGEPILGVFAERHQAAMLEVMTRRYYRIRPLTNVRVVELGGRPLLSAEYAHNGSDYVVVATVARGSDDDRASAVATVLEELRGVLPADRTVLIDLYVTSDTDGGAEPDARAERIRARLGTIPETVGRVSVAVRRPDGGHEGSTWFTFRGTPAVAEGGAKHAVGTPVEDRTLRDLHPMVAERLGLWRLSAFELTRLPSATDVHVFRIEARDVPDDQRLIAIADVRDLTAVRDDAGKLLGLPQLERVFDACLDSLRTARSADPSAAKLEWNRIQLYVWPTVEGSVDELDVVVQSLAPRTEALGLEQVLVQFRTSAGREPGAEPRELMLRMSRPPGAGLRMRVTDPPPDPLRPLDSYTQKVIRARRRGTVYPYELVSLLARSPDRGGAPGSFTEYDLDEAGELQEVDRAPGSNTANIVVGVVSTPTERYPEGLTRVVLLGDPTKALGALSEPECRRVLAAIGLARRLGVPIEWFAVSAGAKIAMDTGTETMDWVSRVLRGIIEFTQAGGEINVVVTGINVGAQPYWNAEATMLMHTKGILVMTPDSTMVLTGKQSLDYSGGVSAEDNFGIGGYDRIMGPNGQAQYWAADLSHAVDVLLAHYAHAYVAPGERFPRPAPSSDPVERDVSSSPHSGPGCDFTTLGEIFDPQTNSERKRPFDVRSLIRGVADADHPPLERWGDMRDAESVVVVDAHLGGQPVAMIGIESRPLPRHGFPPVDGPSMWTAGTLFPRSSKKTARAINAASGNRPLVVLANLSGFDGSPESLRELQLEYGAEIGRAVVNFDGPIVFCVVSRYHGGAFVVFSGTLNDTMEIAAVEGSYASVIGGAPAAAVVFAGEVNKRTAADPRVTDVEAAVGGAVESDDDAGAARLRERLATVRSAVRSEKLGEVADEFDTQHSIERARSMGSVDTIVPAGRLRPYLVDAVQRGMGRTLSRAAGANH